MVLPDTESAQEVSMFNPRHDAWTEHFRFVGMEMVGLTPIGRALVEAFDLNSEKRLRIRGAEEVFGIFPPPASVQEPG